MARLRNLAAAVLIVMLAACASLPPQVGRTPTYAAQDTQATPLAEHFASGEHGHPGESAFHLLPDSVDALLARVILTEKAEKTLDLEYYIWHSDLTGRALALAVLKAADRGVRVRVLLDDLGTNADDQALLALSAHPSISIRLFNPVASRRFKKISAALDFSRVNRRMHNKALIADNRATILGGRNVGDEYFGASSAVSFGDLDVLMHGPIVQDVSNSFDTFWNSDAAYPIDRLMGTPADPEKLAAYRAELDRYVASEQASPYVAHARQRLAQVIEKGAAEYSWGKATLLYDDPSKVTRAPEESQGRLLTALRARDLHPSRELLIISPYFVPGKNGVAWLRELTENGVRVTVLTNSLAATDVAAVHAGYRRYREDLLAAGVQLYEFKPVAAGVDAANKKQFFGSSKASLHAKTFVFDRERVFIGSMNLDPRSVHLNTEIGVLCDSAAIANQVIGYVEPRLNQIAWQLVLRTDANGSRKIVWIDTAADGTVRELDTEPDTTVLRRTGVWFMGLLPIESQL
ncbi:phospholipase D-like domain-containing protein [Paraburkholderia caledonica]|uniref:Cardiolipin synthase n=1 Tax=Paraburkholderia caledonica TaxID=134536 RepID=A0AB73IL07_9BURK|nr:putative cardiolipin synthase [Paraburkholderia caledonica]